MRPRKLILASSSARNDGDSSTTGNVTVNACQRAPIFVVLRRNDDPNDDARLRRAIDARIARRRARPRGKELGESDRLRDELAALGVAIKDNKDGTTTWELKR